MPSPHLWSPDNLLQVIAQCGSDPSCSHTSPFQATSIQETHFPGCYKCKDPSAGCEDSESENVPGEESSPILARGGLRAAAGKRCVQSASFPAPNWELQEAETLKLILLLRLGSMERQDVEGRKSSTASPSVSRVVTWSLEKLQSWPRWVCSCLEPTLCPSAAQAVRRELVPDNRGWSPCEDLHRADRPQG